MSAPKILICDDDANLVQALRLRLERDGYEVITAPDGYTGLARAIEHRPDLLVLDINMPAGDGFSVQRRIRNRPEGAEVPIIYITGDRSESIDSIAERIGLARLVYKPFGYGTLQAEINRALVPDAA